MIYWPFAWRESDGDISIFLAFSIPFSISISDVDTPEPDEKSLITYISSLYDVFPDPPAIHPLYDPVSATTNSNFIH